MAKCISPSAGHSGSTNVLIVGAGKWQGLKSRGRGWREWGGKGEMRPRPMAHAVRPCPGAAGLVCAETLRQEGFSDRIVLCTLDRHLPYDRPKISKVGLGQPAGSAVLASGFPHLGPMHTPSLWEPGQLSCGHSSQTYP